MYDVNCMPEPLLHMRIKVFRLNGCYQIFLKICFQFFLSGIQNKWRHFFFKGGLMLLHYF